MGCENRSGKSPDAKNHNGITGDIMEITTFKNFGKLKLAILTLPINQADAEAVYFVATGIIPNDGTIIGNLYDANDNIVARKRVYSYSGPNKNIPFDNLNKGQEGYLSGQRPDTTWRGEEIKLWMADRQQKFDEKDTKEDLLSKVEEVAFNA